MSRPVTAVVLVALAASSALSVSREDTAAKPTVMIVMLVRNKEPYLPYTLTQLSQLDYPKQQLSLWIRSDHNQDRSAQLLQTWLERYGPLYSAVDAVVNTTSPPLREDEESAVHMSPSRLKAVAAMKQEALQKARLLRTDSVWFLDADVILHDSTVLRQLLDMEKPLVAPMLRSDGEHSNFRDDLSEDLSYEEGSRFSEIYHGHERGCFAVPLVHSCVLVDLRDRRTAELTFVPENLATPTVAVPLDDAVTFALSARQAGLEMNVCNQEDFGQVPVPLVPPQELSEEWRNIVNIKLEVLVDRPPLPVVPIMRLFLPPLPAKSRLGFDRVYTIGLERRPDRSRRLKASFDELGIETVLVHAVDGRSLTDAFLAEHNISSPSMDGWRIKLNKGEIGCFLSHHGVWQDVLDQGLERVLVLENDVRPTTEFAPRLARLVDEADRLRPEWDFLYLHRTKPHTEDDEPVEGAEQLIRPGFCYSAVAYVLTRRGAETLVRDRPLQNMMCSDDYIPFMAGNNPKSMWLNRFPSAGSLKAFSSRENLVEQAKNYGELGYTSDTTELDGVVGVTSCAAEGNMDDKCFLPDL